MPVHSYGILLYRHAADSWKVMLVHPGGPFWAGKDDGAWSIPKGLPEGDEPGLDTALREFREETGFAIDGEFLELGAKEQIRLSSTALQENQAICSLHDRSCSHALLNDGCRYLTKFDPLLPRTPMLTMSI